MSFGDNIKTLRLNNQWTQDFVCSKLNISSGALSRYETGMYEPKSLALVKDFADLYGVSVDFLLDNEDIEISENTIPILGCVKAGYNYLAEENIIGRIQVDGLRDINNCFALKVVGDSMQPVLYENDIVIVHKQETLESSEIGIILIDDEATIKKVNIDNNNIELIAFNSYYPPRKYERNNNNPRIEIIGKVIEARIKKVFE